MSSMSHRLKKLVLIAGSTGVVAAATLAAPGAASAAVNKIGTTPPPVVVSQPTAVALEAFPAGGKGSGSEKTCGLYTGLLQADDYGIDAASNHNDQQALDAAQAKLDKDIDAALDAGCAVIY